MSETVKTRREPLTAGEFRRIMAGLVDPARSDATPGESVYLRETAERLLCAMVKHCAVGDRTAVWSQVDKAIQAALDNHDGSDVEALIHRAVSVLEPDAARLSRCEIFGGLILETAVWPMEQRLRFHAHLATHRLPLLVRARARWKSLKDQRTDAVEATESGIEGGAE